MARTNTIAVSDEEKDQLDKAKSTLFRSPNVHYGEVISALIEESTVEVDSTTDTAMSDSGRGQNTTSKPGAARYEPEDFLSVVREMDGPNNSQIQEAVGTSPQTVGNWKDKLIERGLIRVDDEGRSTNWYLTEEAEQ